MLPKNINDIIINPFLYDEIRSHENKESNKTYMSYSLTHYCDVLKQQIEHLYTIQNKKEYIKNEDEISMLCNITNSHSYIYEPIAGKDITISNLDIKNYLFYDVLELLFYLNIKDCITYTNITHIGYFTNHFLDLKECFYMYINHPSTCYSNEYIIHNHLFSVNNKYISSENFDLGFFQIMNGLRDLFIILLIIMKQQTHKGNTIIHINNINNRIIVDLIYLLSSLYEKVYICKPSTSNLLNNNKYIVCKSFIKKQDNLDANINIIYSCLNYIDTIDTMNSMEIVQPFQSILNYIIPYYFQNKINEINIIIGQQQLEIMEQIISIYKSKNKDDKIQLLIKNNIQNSIHWCEKHKIPYNKSFDKSNNIFYQQQI
jgi:hypothetical protein